MFKKNFVFHRELINECPGYDIKQSDGEAPVLELWGIYYYQVHSDPEW